MRGARARGLIVAAALLVAAGGPGACAAPADKDEGSSPAADERAAVPAAEARQKAVREIRDIYKREYATAKKPAERGTLATRLLENAQETADDPTSRYALLEEALALAIAAGRFNLAKSVADQLGQDFQVEPLAGQVELCLELLKKPPTEATERQDFEQFVPQLVDDAIDQERLDLAERVIAAASGASAPGRNATLRKAMAERQQLLKSLKPRYEAAQQARETLERDADDRVAHDELGRYLCFLRGKWDQGLPHLARSNSKSLAALARRSRQPPDEADPLAALADEWWTLADSLDAAEKMRVRAFAADFYRRALPDLKGLKALAAKQRAGVAEPKPAESKPGESKTASESPRTRRQETAQLDPARRPEPGRLARQMAHGPGQALLRHGRVRPQGADSLHPARGVRLPDRVHPAQLAESGVPGNADAAGHRLLLGTRWAAGSGRVFARSHPAGRSRRSGSPRSSRPGSAASASSRSGARESGQWSTASRSRRSRPTTAI